MTVMNLIIRLAQHARFFHKFSANKDRRILCHTEPIWDCVSEIDFDMLENVKVFF
jgi:hypothetical protein